MTTSIQMLIKLAITLLFIAIAQLTLARQSDTINVLMLDFEKEIPDTNDESTFNIKEQLAALLADHKGINLLNKEAYTDIDLNNLKSPEQIAKLKGVDIVVYGSYHVDDEDIRIQTRFFSVEKQLFRRLGNSSGKQSSIHFLVEVIYKNIYNEIIEIYPTIQESIKTIAVFFNYKIENGGKNHDLELKAEEFTRKIIVGIKNTENTVVLPWAEVKKHAANVEGFANVVVKVKADGLIKLSFLFTTDGDLKSVTPKFRTNEGNVLRLAEFKTNYYKSFDSVKFVISEIQGLLSNIVTSSGQWNATYLNEPMDSKRFITKANDYFRKGNFYFSNYYYYKSLSSTLPNLDEIDIRLQIGYNKVHLYRLDEAEEEFNFALSKEPENGKASFGLALVDYYRFDVTLTNAALEQLEKAKRNGFKDFFPVEALKGYLYFNVAEFEKAIVSFNEALQYPDQSSGLFLVDKNDVEIAIGLCYIEMPEIDRSIEYFEELFSKNPEIDDVRYYYSIALASKGIKAYNEEDYKNAIKYFSQAKLYDKDTGIKDLYRQALIFERQFDEANELIEDEIESGNYDKETIYFTHGTDIRRFMINSSNNGDFDKEIGRQAIKMLDKNLLYNPDDPVSLFYLGNINFLFGDIDEAISQLEMANGLDKENPDIQINLMRAYLVNNDYDDCITHYADMKEINDGVEMIRRNKALMDFLVVSAYMAKGEKVPNKIDKKLNKLLKQEFLIDYWSYDSYTTWLDQCDCTPETQKILEDLQKLMEDKK